MSEMNEYCDVCDGIDDVRLWDQSPVMGPAKLCSRHYRDWSDLFGAQHQVRQWTGEAS